MLPQANTAFVDPFTELPTLNLICNIQDPITGEDYHKDPRHVATRAANYLTATGTLMWPTLVRKRVLYLR